jgi:hypothetical protein
MSVRRFAALLALLLAFPVAAHAQSGAGDDQYQDPFGNSQGSSGSKGTGSSGSGSNDSNMPPLSSAPPASTAPTTSSPPSASASAAQGSQLAATGADPVLLALLGGGLLLGGSGLRLRLRVD